MQTCDCVGAILTAAFAFTVAMFRIWLAHVERMELAKRGRKNTNDNITPSDGG